MDILTLVAKFVVLKNDWTLNVGASIFTVWTIKTVTNYTFTNINASW
jgi:hypothetical protein